MRRVAVAAFVLIGARVLHADTIDDGVKQLADLAAAGESAKCVAKIVEMKDFVDPRVLAELRDLAKSADDRIACAAIQTGAAHKDPKLLEWLRARIEDKELFKEKGGRPDVYNAVLEALPAYRDAATLKALAEVERGFLNGSAEFSPPAIRAFGSVAHKSVVDQLITWLAAVEQSHGGKSSGGAGGNQGYTAETTKARDASRAAILETLAALTDQDQGDYAGWKKWWSEHAATFVFPKPDAPDAGDVSKLAEWTDARYGYTVKRPDAADWAFKGRDAYYRIQLAASDPGGVLRAFVGWNVYRTTGSSFKDLRSYVEWWTGKQIPEHEIGPFAPGGEPTAETKKFGGREWTVISANGTTKGGLAGWGAVEHRVYVTKIDVGFLYAWALVKTTTVAEDKQRAWDAAEKTIVAGK